MIKLAISHGLSQSVKTSLFEDLVDNTIDETKDIPAEIASSGKINLNKKQINMQIGELFILRISIHLQGSVLDAPELMWAEPQLDPVYQAVRSYLEMDQRVSLLTERLNVIGDLLAVLKDQLTVTHVRICYSWNKTSADRYRVNCLSGSSLFSFSPKCWWLLSTSSSTCTLRTNTARAPCIYFLVYDTLLTAREGVWATSRGQLHGVRFAVICFVVSGVILYHEGRNAWRGCSG
jgi:hypothetical protein